MEQRAQRVLFISTGNAARSLIAEALLNAKKSSLYSASSAGTAPLDCIHPETRAFLQQSGFETAKLHPKRWQDFHAAQSLVPIDIIVTLSEEAKEACPSGWAGVRAHWTLDDPLGTNRADVREWKFHKCLSTLDARIEALVRGRPATSQTELWLRLKDIGMVV